MRALFKFLSSIWLTVALLTLSMVLVFGSTLEQTQWGVFEVQKRFFESLVCVWTYPLALPGAEHFQWLKIPLPGGFLLGGLLLINLACAHLRYFRASWKKCGIVLIHTGIVLLLISGFLTAYLQEEYFMWLDVNGHSNYLESFHDHDLVFIDHTDGKTDTVVSIPVSRLVPGETIRDAALPFTVKTLGYFPNSDVGTKANFPDLPEIPADQGIASVRDLRVANLPYNYNQDTANFPSAVISLETPKGPLGGWLVSEMFEPRVMTMIFSTIPPIFSSHLPQTFTVDGHKWEVVLRPRRVYLPYTLTLDVFTHANYPGTDIPKTFESQAHLTNPATGENRPVLIYMNHPLRYGGFTFYQASFSPGDTASKLQVVRNPGALLPYIAVALVGVGMTVHFILSLATYLRRDRATPTPARHE